MFDEICIRTVPRYKMSDLSGDEWRISAVIEFYRKGVKVKTTGPYRDVKIASLALGKDFLVGRDEGIDFTPEERAKCDQEGCAAKGTVFYRKRADYCRYCGEGHVEVEGSVHVRVFCTEHATRGDCGLDDADRNYARFEPTEEELAEICH